MSNLIKRFLTALVAGTAAVTAMVVSGYGLMLLCFIVSMAGLWEFLGFSVSDKRYKWTMMGLGGLIWVAMLVMSLAGVTEMDSHLFHFTMGLLPILGLVTLYNEKEKQPLQNLGGMILAFVYCYLPFLLFFFMGFTENGYNYRIPLGILVLTWSLDVGAYFAGKYLGKRPLFSRISPKKTWAGSIGGGIICMGLAVLMQNYEIANEDIFFNWIVVGAIITVISQFGDLVESMIKRSVSVKDSGSILPGHGGMLDRFDGPYLSIPILFILFLPPSNNVRFVQEKGIIFVLFSDICSENLAAIFLQQIFLYESSRITRTNFSC